MKKNGKICREKKWKNENIRKKNGRNENVDPGRKNMGENFKQEYLFFNMIDLPNLVRLFLT